MYGAKSLSFVLCTLIFLFAYVPYKWMRHETYNKLAPIRLLANLNLDLSFFSAPFFVKAIAFNCVEI